jgi:lipid A oxidase
MKCLAKAEQAVTSAALVAFAFAGVLAVGADAGTALADSQIAVFGGWNDSFDSDITAQAAEGHPRHWWLANNPNWGLMFDYSHAKVVADKGAVVSVSGRRDGTAIGPTDKVGNTFQVMEFTDGLNEFFFGAQYRWPHERWTPYVGFGVGPSVPHVEVRRPGVGQPYTFEYQLAGVDVEGLVGIEYRFGPHVSAFADYKLSFAINDTDLKGGGSLDTDIWTNHIIFGLSYRFGAPPSAAYPPPPPRS